MKKATVFAAALALLLSLAACGNQDNNAGQTGNPAGANNGQTNSGQTNNGTGENGGVDGNDTRSNGSLTTPNNNTGTNYSVNNNAGTAANGRTTGERSWTGTDSRVGNDLRRAADGVGNAVTDLANDGRDLMSRTASTTTFERMLDNARVHDTDGVLSDGENSRW